MGKLPLYTHTHTHSKRQDAHGLRKDDWLDPGNGERRGRGDFESQLVTDRKIPVFKAKLLCFLSLWACENGKVLPRWGLSAVAVSSVIVQSAC